MTDESESLASRIVRDKVVRNIRRAVEAGQPEQLVEALAHRPERFAHGARSTSGSDRPGAVLDAVTVIALMSPGNAHHDTARETLHQLDGTLKLMHPINMAEVLVKPAADGTAEQVQDALAQAGIVTFTTTPGEPLVLARARALTRLRMPDTCAYVTAQARGLPLVTFDRRLTIAARAAGLTVLGAPDEWMP